MNAMELAACDRTPSVDHRGEAGTQKAAARGLAGLRLWAVGADRELDARAAQMLDRGFNWQVAPATGPSLKLYFHWLRVPPATAAPPSPVEHLAIQVDKTNVVLDFGHARCVLEPLLGNGRIECAPEYWSLPLKLQQEVVILALLWLMQPYGLHALHATAVVGSAGTLLLAGASGSGKSTTALSLIRAGWRSLADDVVLYQHYDDAFRFWGLPRGFAFSPELIERDAALATMARHSSCRVGAKIFALMEAAAQSYSERLSAVIFPTVVDADRSRLLPIAASDAIAGLIAVSAGLVVDTDSRRAQRQLQSLAQLAASAPAFRLEAGRDIFGNGDELNRLLATQGLAGEMR